MKICKVIFYVIMLSLVTASTAYASVALSFPDVPIDADYAEAVVDLEELGIITGDEYGNFNPNKTVTRAEFATMILRMLGEADRAKSITASSFTDVPSIHWACGYIAVAVELGIVNGYGNDIFGPEDPLTFEQAIKVLVCTLGLEDDAIDAGGYPDGYISVAIDIGITKSNEVTIETPIVRSKVAELISRTLEANE